MKSLHEFINEFNDDPQPIFRLAAYELYLLNVLEVDSYFDVLKSEIYNKLPNEDT